MSELIVTYVGLAHQEFESVDRIPDWVVFDWNSLICPMKTNKKVKTKLHFTAARVTDSPDLIFEEIKSDIKFDCPLEIVSIEYQWTVSEGHINCSKFKVGLVGEIK